MGAVFTEKVVVQRLTDFVWAGTSSPLNEPQCRRITRILYSLRRSIAMLEDYYLEVKVGQRHGPRQTRYFPSITTYCDQSTGEVVSFVYVKPLENDSTCVTFLAQTNEPQKDIVVKFVERYSEAAHRLLEAQGTAPKLFYYGKVGINEGDPTYGHLRMVVMEYIDGITAREAQKSGELPETFNEQIKKSVDHLHDNDLVFGDLRDVNIMITKNGVVKFIDFDWAGNEQEVLYPLFLSDEIKWADGVTLGGIIEKRHDVEMLEKLLHGLD